MQFELKITIDSLGKIQVSGPINNKSLCYGMLEMARDAIKDYADRANRNGIIGATEADLTHLGGNDA